MMKSIDILYLSCNKVRLRIKSEYLINFGYSVDKAENLLEFQKMLGSNKYRLLLLEYSPLSGPKPLDVGCGNCSFYNTCHIKDAEHSDLCLCLHVVKEYPDIPKIFMSEYLTIDDGIYISKAGIELMVLPGQLSDLLGRVGDYLSAQTKKAVD